MNVKAVSKAIAGALAAVIVAWLARNNVVVDSPAIAGIIEYVLVALIGFVTVWAAPRNQDGPRL